MLIKTETVGHFEINFYAEPEYESLSELFPDDTEEEIAEMEKNIENCKLVYFCAKVTASLCGIELASDYLGGCVYDSYEQFTELDGDHYSDRKDTVLRNARTTINDLVVMSEMEM